MGNISTLERAWLLGVGRYVQCKYLFLSVGYVEVLGGGCAEKASDSIEVKSEAGDIK